MRATPIVVAALACIILGGASLLVLGGESILQSPGFAPSKVDEGGTIHEEWGAVTLRLTAPEGAAQRVVEGTDGPSPFPAAVTAFAAGPVTLVGTAYRAPIWPAGVDVLAARLVNGADAAVEATLELMVAPPISFGETMGVAGGRPVVALPKGLERVRVEERPWGSAGGVTALPGWAKPAGECDPAFSNISAGMGGVPIVYRFAVQPGGERQVVLGFCESHWAIAGQRPLEIRVEGAPKAEIDPIAAWGQHKPGCLAFKARDANGDGRLEVTVAPHPAASDRNTILNVIWVFAPNVAVDTAQVLRGAMSSAAEYYVDVGGEKDQLLYKGDKVTYTIKLAPKAEHVLTFMLASPGCPAVPNPETTAWTPETLRKAAADVWAAYPSLLR